jgi:TonB family protein
LRRFAGDWRRLLHRSGARNPLGRYTGREGGRHRRNDPRAPGHCARNPAATNTAGFVKARLVIDQNGLVKNVEILSATDNAAAQSARDALAQWKFTPTFVDGAPVQVVHELKITFKQPG